MFSFMALSLAISIDAIANGISFGVLRNAELIPTLIIAIVCEVSFES